LWGRGRSTRRRSAGRTEPNRCCQPDCTWKKEGDPCIVIKKNANSNCGSARCIFNEDDSVTDTSNNEFICDIQFKPKVKNFTPKTNKKRPNIAIVRYNGTFCSTTSLTPRKSKLINIRFLFGKTRSRTRFCDGAGGCNCIPSSKGPAICT